MIVKRLRRAISIVASNRNGASLPFPGRRVPIADRFVVEVAVGRAQRSFRPYGSSIPGDIAYPRATEREKEGDDATTGLSPYFRDRMIVRSTRVGTTTRNRRYRAVSRAPLDRATSVQRGEPRSIGPRLDDQITERTKKKKKIKTKKGNLKRNESEYKRFFGK